MTSLLSAPDRTRTDGSGDARHRRPLVPLAGLGGALAAGATLLVCLAVGVVGWFATDAGGHGEPRDGLQVGALGWLMAHGSGIHVAGVAITAVPLLLTLVCGWATWRVGHRVGDAISGHGPDAERLADGERDWTVPAATGLFAGGYAAVTLLTARLAGSEEAALDTGRALLWSVLIAGCVGGPAIAVGSGRAAIWAAHVSPSLRVTLRTCRAVVMGWLLVSLIALLAALVADLGTAANVLSQLHLSGGEATLYLLGGLLVLPNATVFSGSYLLGPGFMFGAKTMVTPTAVVLGPLPMFPMLAALPDDGLPPVWTAYLIAVPALVAAVAAARVQRAHPSLRWDEGPLRGCAGGLLAGVAAGVLATLAGGAIGPGRMQLVAPYAFDVLVHAITAFGLGGLLGGLAMTWWQRRAARPAERAVDDASVGA